MRAWIAQRLPRWSQTAPDESRWIVLDLETSGFNQRKDDLLAIGAVAMRDGRLINQDSFEMLVRPQVASERENILVHRIGAEAQLSASDPEHACRRFAEYAGRAPLVAFHAPFDRGFLLRGMRTHARMRLDNPWLDLADLAPALFPGVRAQNLDEWLAFFEIELEHRHHAASDAFATAMLFARLLGQMLPADRNLAAMQLLCQRVRKARAGH